MARHNFEKEFSRKLQDREIEPSAQSWEKLQEKLDAAEESRKSGFNLKWMGIAASLVGGLLILGLMFNDDRISHTPQVVDTPSEEVEMEGKNQVFEPVELVTEEVAEPIEEKPAEVVKKAIKEKTSLPEVTAVTAVEASEESKQKEQLVDDSGLQIADEKIAGKLEQVVSEISSEENRNGEITDAEIEELLRNAAAEISLQKSLANTENIDPGSLLWEVEMELERSFREKVFDVLKESYLKTKTAVANRSF
ncbi:hypothetical protein GCM10007103_05320 [Salinimicrobium marinum]|uniref:Uncharacterized protein n=1 Tax=Salinimicrobium marinum TaxID=680283 RepID=A0A918VVK1_9FLAO|nr:hypothetical protein [Salinimicrobium marinum]GHA26870.1 hypothetical protein GCM10007103_05320 [Salinimicrobium marinum]